MAAKIEKYLIKFKGGVKAPSTESFDFSKEELTIGREDNCDIRFDPEQDLMVSRNHGKIIRKPDDSIVITDNNSRNGIFVNNRRIEGSAWLKPGDVVRLGNNGPSFEFDLDPRPPGVLLPTQVIAVPPATRVVETGQVNSTTLKIGSGYKKWLAIPLLLLLAGGYTIWQGHTQRNTVAGMTGDGELGVQIFPLHAMMPAAYKVYANPGALDGRYYFSKIVLDNKGAGQLQNVKVEYAVPGYINWTQAAEIKHILPKGSSVVTIYPQFPQKVTEKSTESTERMQIRVTYQTGGKPEKYEKTYPFQMLSRNDFLYTNVALSEIRGIQDMEDNNDLAPVFITPQDPIVKYYTQQVQEKVLGGETASVGRDMNEAIRFIKGVYEAARRSGMVYSGTSGLQAELGDIHSTQQKVRLPREVITGNTGLCIEMAFLYTSVFAAEGLEPFVFFVPGHAYPGVRFNGQFLAIESTAVNGAGLGGVYSADEAFEKGMKNLQKFFENYQQGVPGYSIIDVNALVKNGVQQMELNDDAFLRVKVDEMAQRMAVGGPMVPQHKPTVQDGQQVQ